MDLQILDLDGAVTQQQLVCEDRLPVVVPLQEWGPRIRMACSFSRFDHFRRAIDRSCPTVGRPQFTFCGSGDFHHVTLALLQRLSEPINLLAIDNHPDWMCGVPLLHCGTWLWHALRLPTVVKVFHVGGHMDFENFYRRLAPWEELTTGKVVVFPARRRFSVGRWAQVETYPMAEHDQLTRSRLEQLLQPHLRELALRPLYISIDKDVLVETEAVVNWDSGKLSLDEVTLILALFAESAQHRLAGVDTVGDWSPVRMDGLFREVLHYVEHPLCSTVDRRRATAQNAFVNRTLLAAVGQGR